ncbi:Spermidine export protein MdtI [Rhodanobacter lindaniclasticus]
MAWIYLLLAGLFEIVWAIGLKDTDGFSPNWPSVGTLAAMAVSIVLLAMAVKTLPIGTAYAIWTGIGALGAVALGIVLFGDPGHARAAAVRGADPGRHRRPQAQRRLGTRRLAFGNPR